MVDDELLACLESLGPCLASTLASRLCAEFGISPAAARKRIQRYKASGKIGAHEMRFKANEQFLYLPWQEHTDKFSASFIEALTQANSPLADCISIMKARGGLIPENLFPVISGVPFQGNPKLSSEIIKTILFKRHIVQTAHFPSGKCLRLSSEIIDDLITESRMRARLRAEEILLTALLDWLRLQGFVTAYKASLRSEVEIPQHGFFAWDLVAPSYISGFTRYDNGSPTPGFVVADVSLGHTMSLSEVQYFINKCGKLRAQGHRPSIAMLIANWFDQDALEAGRKQGLIFTTPKNLFGRDLSDLLLNLETLFDDNISTISSREQALAELMEKSKALQHLQGVSANLAAQNFELVVGHCLSKTRGPVLYNRPFEDINGGECEVDVLVLQPQNAVIAIECKSKLSGSLVSVKEVERWFAEVVPALYKKFVQDQWYQNASYEFSLWTNSDFHPDAVNRLKQLEQTKRYSVTWKNGQQVKEELSKYGDTRLLQQYKTLFIQP
ncbi:MAG: hypothetical protein QG574_590 [Cyanobacteriota bacterium erpe_2018_sw_21hr_WHONDRS-SW48-000092_B_bin.40]|jgi:hypothetical protein|nr:hypothetical protein [Cyanobacteriota bacterium erpe_2018_sw_21hr_WHONDRS-SW48-000092_B_bin.40]